MKDDLLETNSLSMEHTDKSFIGKISVEGFRVITAQLPFGLAVVLEAKFNLEETDGDLKMTVHPFLKFMSLFLFIFIVAGIILSIITKDMGIRGIGLLVPLSMFVIVWRFIFLNFLFSGGKNLALEKLSLLFNIN